jgi:microcystin-dependent protein
MELKFISFCSRLTLYFALSSLQAQVGVNIIVPHASAALQIESPPGVTKGLLTPSMTTANRMSITTWTNVAADGLVVYDVNHRMHYYYNAGLNRWVSLSPLTLSTPTIGSASYPSGAITTPSTSPPTTFSMGINKQVPAQVLDVVGGATVSGNVSAGGNLTISGNSTINGSSSVSGVLNVAGYPSNALVPAGGIIMWTGTTPPAGWALCNGSLGTPDLRGRFIVAYDPATPATPALLSGPATANVTNYGATGNRGGANAHTILLSEMASHNHNVTANLNHSSLFAFTSGAVAVGNGAAYYGNPQTVNVNVSQTAQGGNQPHENRPPYYVLAFIMKLP